MKFSDQIWTNTLFSDKIIDQKHKKPRVYKKKNDNFKIFKCDNTREI